MPGFCARGAEARGTTGALTEMKGHIKQRFAYRFILPGIFLVSILALVACGGGRQPDLVIPTPAVTAAMPTLATATATAIPPTITPPPPATSTAAPEPTTPPATIATAETEQQAATEYRVAFVAANDTLNVRRQPSANAAVVAQLPADASGIEVIGEGQTLLSGSLWLPVETAAGDGWVNSAYLTETVSPEAFCTDRTVSDLLEQLEAAVAAEDGEALEELVHPDRGIRLRLNWWNPEVIVSGEDVRALFSAPKQYDWGVEDGSGEAIRGSFSEIVMPRLERDLLGATAWRCDEGQFGSTAGATALPEGYEAVNFYSAHRPGPAEQEMDWGTWLIGVERWEGRYYVSYLVHYRWEI